MVDMNMSETLISFATAKLAKEKGFTNPVYWHYCLINNEWILRGNSFLVREQDVVMDKDEGKNGIEVSVEGDRLFRNYLWKDSIYLKASDCPFIAAPTQSLLQKWLREVHNVIVISLPYTTSVNNVEPVYIWMIYKISSSTKNSEPYTSYEEALGNGLYEALKLIKV